MQVGNVYLNNGDEYNLSVGASGDIECNPLPGEVRDIATVETMFFPFMFLYNRGFFKRGIAGMRTLAEYMRLRMNQWFSPFTLCKMYIPHMWQLRQCQVVANSVSSENRLVVTV